MINKPKLIIVGAGEFANIAYEYFTYDSEYEVHGFIAEKKFITKKRFNGLPVSAFENIKENYPANEYKLFIAIPALDLNHTRKRLYLTAKKMGYSFVSYVSSKAFVWRNAKIGENCFIFENNTIQPFVKVGNNVIIWSGNHIGHRTKINDHVFISSHVVISGFCNIGSGSFLGVNSTFNDETSIGNDCLLASGSLINKKFTSKNKVYVGVPANEIPNKNAKDIML